MINAYVFLLNQNGEKRLHILQESCAKKLHLIQLPEAKVNETGE